MGFDWIADVTRKVCPRSAARRLRLHSLAFGTMKKDSAKLAPNRNAYVLLFRKPGERHAPVTSYARGEIDEATWVEWANGVWEGPETDVLGVRGTGGEDDEKHVCPMVLWVIRRCVVLYTNPGDLVIDPFGGIGSTAVVCAGGGYEDNDPRTLAWLPRRALSIDLKREHHLTAVANLRAVERLRARMDAQGSLFGAMAPAGGPTT